MATGHLGGGAFTFAVCTVLEPPLTDLATKLSTYYQQRIPQKLMC